MKISVIFYLLILLFNSTRASAQNTFGVRLFLTPKVCISNNSGANMNYHFPTSGGNDIDNRASLALTTDWAAQGRYNIRPTFSAILGIGSSYVRQAFKESDVVHNGVYKRVYYKYFFQKATLLFEKRFTINRNSFFLVDFGSDFIFDLFRNRPKYKGALVEKYRRNENEKSYGEYEVYVFKTNVSTFNPILSLGIGYQYKLWKKISFVATLDFKQGFKPQVNSVAYYYEYYPSSPGHVGKSHVYSGNNGQSLNLNLGIDYSF
ncbi:MAG: hypothetical protein R2831_03690 [Chitinophagaceae bacterium]